MDNVAVEIERKYIISKPDFATLVGMPGYHSSLILQIYLDSSKGATHRIRSRRDADGVKYTETTKVRIDSMSVYEDEREISEGDFVALSKKIKSGTLPISKTRHRFDHAGLVIEIDEYPEWHNTCIMEIELPSREYNAKIPEFINIVKEVTGDGAYSNAAMSRAFPKEEI